MAKSIENRLATLEADMANMTKTQDAIFTYMKEGRDQREKMIAGFATLTEQASQSLKYQQSCDFERREIKDDVDSLKNTRTRQYGMAAGIAGVVSVIGWAVNQWK